MSYRVHFPSKSKWTPNTRWIFFFVVSLIGCDQPSRANNEETTRPEKVAESEQILSILRDIDLRLKQVSQHLDEAKNQPPEVTSEDRYKMIILTASIDEYSQGPRYYYESGRKNRAPCQVEDYDFLTAFMDLGWECSPVSRTTNLCRKRVTREPDVVVDVENDIRRACDARAKQVPMHTGYGGG